MRHVNDEREGGARSRALCWLGWAALAVVTGLEALAMGSAGLAKYLSMDGWMYWFARFGYPPRLALLIGAFEFVGAGLLLVPRLASWSAVGLGAIMIGALHAVLTTETDLGTNGPLIHMASLAVIGAAQWKRRWRPGRRPPLR